jgi:hypothetical protein
MKKLFKRAYVLAFCLFIVSPLAASAQTPIIGSGLTLDTIPSNPGPNQNITVTATSYILDLDTTSITWSVDGQVVKQGTGITSIQITTNGIGKTTTVDAVATSDAYGTVERSLTITPASVSLIWEALSYTPPFYEGKALHSMGGLVRVVAMPKIIDASGNQIDPSKLIYKWTLNGQIMGNDSGYGKQVLNVTNESYLQGGNDVSVTVSTPDSSLAANGDVFITPSDPKVVLYNNDPIQGIEYNAAVGDTLNLHQQNTFSLVAEPYFFNTASRDDQDSLKYTWQLNGQTITLPIGNQQSMLTLQNTSTSNGQSAIHLSIQSITEILQGAQKDLTVNYGN